MTFKPLPHPRWQSVITQHLYNAKQAKSRWIGKGITKEWQSFITGHLSNAKQANQDEWDNRPHSGLH